MGETGYMRYPKAPRGRGALCHVLYCACAEYYTRDDVMWDKISLATEFSATPAHPGTEMADGPDTPAPTTSAAGM